MITILPDGRDAFVLSDGDMAVLRCRYSCGEKEAELLELEELETFSDPGSVLHCAVVRAVLSKLVFAGVTKVLCRSGNPVMCRTLDLLKTERTDGEYRIDTVEFFARKCDGCGN